MSEPKTALDLAEEYADIFCVVQVPPGERYWELRKMLLDIDADSPEQIAALKAVNGKLVDALRELRKIGIERMNIEGAVMHLATAPEGCDCITHRAQAELLVARDLLAEAAKEDRA